MINTQFIRVFTYKKWYFKGIRLCSSHTSSKVRVRFAPSPTGLLHLGGLRTALYNYLFAKSQGGAFILRIEDTDQSRLVAGAVDQLQSDLEWAGIKLDEGPKCGGSYGPYNQSERLHIYKKEVDKLIREESAYLCFCTESRLNLLRKEALKVRQVPKYDNRCRHLSREEIIEKLHSNHPYCVRFKLISDEVQTYDDLVYGTVSHDVTAVEGDPIIMKTDGFPTYHLANVVDDHVMEISHVLRGVEWQPSTPKHMLLYKAFGWKPPLFGHLPLLVNADGTKFSKRQGDMTIKSFREKGITACALVNFVTFTGGLSSVAGDPHQPRTFSIDQLIQMFSLQYVNTSPCKLMFDQLPEYNRAELAKRIENHESLAFLVTELKQLIIRTVSAHNEDLNNLDLNDEHLVSILKWCIPRVTKLEDLVGPELLFLWSQPSLQQISDPSVIQHKDLIIKLVDQLRKLEMFDQASVKDLLKRFAEENDTKFNVFMKCLRLCLSGLKASAPVGDMMEMLGKEYTCKRLDRVRTIVVNHKDDNLKKARAKS